MEEIIGSFLYFPDKIPVGMPPPPWSKGAEEVWIRTEDGLNVHGLWWGEPTDAPVILFFHGNAQEVYSWSLVREDLKGVGCRLLLIDYRGYGKSEGFPTEEGLYADGRAALSWLEKKAVEEGEIFIFGKSLGGAVACEVARNRDIRGLILESTFTSLESVAARLFPFEPEAHILHGMYDSMSKIEEIKCPVLVIHGTDDELIPFREGKAIFAAVKGPRELFAVEGAGHNNVSIVAGSSYGERIKKWIEKEMR